MKKLVLNLCLIFCLITLISNKAIASELNIIPKPLNSTQGVGYFSLNSSSSIIYNNDEIAYLAHFLNDFLHVNFKRTLRYQKSPEQTSSEEKSGTISFILDSNIQDESYQLSIKPNSVTVTGSEAGLFYGLQSIKQLISPYETGSIKLPVAEIIDKPRFEYRGAMLDVARYFFSVEEVKRFIDLMAFYKLNTFHWHLTEDAGWRIEIKKYPLLTQIGAWRRGTQSNHDPASFDRLPHGGFYTQEQIKDVVEYAQQKNITIIPEFDMPGHTLTVLAAYPEVSCTGGPFKVLEQWGIQEDILCAGNEHTYKMVEDILDEILELFPSEIIHIGGDEAPKERWKACHKCQAKMEEQNLQNEDELQSYFIKRVSTYLQSKGRRALGWDEIMDGGLAPNTMVMSWRGEEGGIKAAQLGHEVVMAPNVFMYLDYYQGVPEEEPLNIWGDVPLRRVYEYEPFSPQIPAENHKYIIGVQGNLWMEYIHSLPKLDYMAFPRLAAVAEVNWSEPEKDFDDFQTRLSYNLRWLDKKGVNFRVPNPIGLRNIETNETKTEVTLNPPIQNSVIYYTLDGRDPLQYGIKYESPIKIDLSEDDSVELQTVVRTETGRVSGTRKATVSINKEQ